jgi:hypothetical protein
MVSKLLFSIPTHTLCLCCTLQCAGFDWAVHSFDENVTVWIELSSQKFSGYVATQDNPPLKFLYMKEALFVTPYFEFLMLTNCPSGAATGNATELPYECGEVVVAGITREGCAQCAERKDYCDPLFEYCMKPVANYLNQNTTVIPNITVKHCPFSSVGCCCSIGGIHTQLHNFLILLF